MKPIGLIRTLIVDDEPPARANLRALLERDPEIEIVDDCESGSEAVQILLRNDLDLVFLDIQMPEISGFDVIEKVGPNMPAVVFATAHDEFAIRAFEARGLDYLLKPFDDARFSQVLTRAKLHVRRERQADLARRMEDLVRDQIHGQSVERLQVRDGKRTVVLDVKTIDWIESADYHVRVHTSGQSYPLRETMDRLETRLGDRSFVRVHRTAIVRLDRIVEIKVGSGNAVVVLSNGVEVRLSRSRRKLVERRLRAE